MKKGLSIILTAGMLLTMAAPLFAEENSIPMAESGTEVVISQPTAGAETAVSQPTSTAGTQVDAPTLPGQTASSQNVSAQVQLGEAIEQPTGDAAEIDNADGETWITGAQTETGELLGDMEMLDGAVDLSGDWLAMSSEGAAANVLNAPAKATYYIPGSTYNTRDNTTFSIDGMRVYTDITMKNLALVNDEAINGVVLQIKSGTAPYANVYNYSVFSANSSNVEYQKEGKFLADGDSVAQVGINFTKMPDGAYQIWLYPAHFNSKSDFRYQAPAATYRVTKAGTDLYFDRPQSYYYADNGLQFISTRVGMEEALSLTDYKGADYAAVQQTARDITKNCASDVEKMQAVHDWVADNIAYDYEGMANGDEAIYNAGQTFSRRRGVCSGVSRLINVMLRTVKVPCVSIQGNLTSGGKTNSFEKANQDFSKRPESFLNHEWNAVYVNGGWNYIDATSDMGSKWYGKGHSQNVTKRGMQTYYVQGLDAFALSHVSMRVGVYDNDANTIGPSEPSTGASAAQTKAFVTRLYKNVLEREPDTAGLNNWVNSLMTAKSTAADVVANFFLSTEFSARALTDEQRVTIAYKTMLDRAPESAGAAGWVDALGRGASMRFLAYGFVGSPEFTALCKEYGITRGTISLTEARDKNLNITGFVQRLYETCLGRKSDVTGLNGWCEMMLTKTKTAKEVARFFVFSQEFQNKKYNNTDYIKQLYLAFMGRAYDEAGLTAWNAAMTKGMTREQVFENFANSKEFSNICAEFGV